jgi:hypothetical protein
MRNALFVFVSALTLASGQGTRMPPERRQAILDYPLTMQRADQLIAALPAMTKYVASLPPAAIAKSMKQTPAEQLANMESNPQVMAILKPNGLTPKEYVIGVPTLRMALMLAQGVPASESVFASPANLAFAKANLAQLKPRWDAADGMGSPRK